MATNNFYADLRIDGKEIALKGGPRSKDGGLSGTIKVRDNGERKVACFINAWADKDGNLEIDFRPGENVNVEQIPSGGFRIKAKR